MNTIFIFFIIGLSLYLIFSFGYFFVCLLRGIKISKQTIPFKRNGVNTSTIGIFGDSTALGVGASIPEKSLAGLLGSSNPQTTIVNISTNGFSIGQIADVLEKQNNFDKLFICCGGIDILYLKNNHQVRKDIQRLFLIANNKSDKIIIVTPLNLGLSSAFPWFIKKFFLQRSKEIGKIFQDEAQKFPKIFVSNNLTIDSQKLIPSWQKISAFDRIHPNDEGYRWVFERIKSKVEFFANP